MVAREGAGRGAERVLVSTVYVAGGVGMEAAVSLSVLLSVLRVLNPKIMS